MRGSIIVCNKSLLFTKPAICKESYKKHPLFELSFFVKFAAFTHFSKYLAVL